MEEMKIRNDATSSSSSTSGAGDESYEVWSARGAEATRGGNFASALAAYTRALEIAREADDRHQEDGAALNLAMVLIQMGEARRGTDGLREILLRTSDARMAFAAAYHLASSLRRQGRYEKALAYARRAMERATDAKADDLLAPAHNLLGNILLNQSYLDEALGEYETALEIWDSHPAPTPYLKAILEENLGYCLLLKDRLEEGTRRIRHALGLAREVGDHRCVAECKQDLCYGLLLQGEYAEAAAMGEAALADARENAYRDIEENCHYLLGEIGTKTGNLERRDRHFERLQALHPELPFLKDFLCAVDVTGFITLKR